MRPDRHRLTGAAELAVERRPVLRVRRGHEPHDIGIEALRAVDERARRLRRRVRPERDRGAGGRLGHRDEHDRADNSLGAIEAGHADLLAEIDHVAVEVGIVGEEIAHRAAGLIGRGADLPARFLDGGACLVEEGIGGGRAGGDERQDEDGEGGFHDGLRFAGGCGATIAGRVAALRPAAAPGKSRPAVRLQGSTHHSSSSKSAGQAASSATRSR